MKSMKEIIQELGWEDDANEAVAKAFIRNLVKSAEQSNRPIALKQTGQKSQKSNPKTSDKAIPQQLSFDLFKASGEK